MALKPKQNSIQRTQDQVNKKPSVKLLYLNIDTPVIILKAKLNIQIKSQSWELGSPDLVVVPAWGGPSPTDQAENHWLDNRVWGYHCPGEGEGVPWEEDAAKGASDAHIKSAQIQSHFTTTHTWRWEGEGVGCKDSKSGIP